MQRRLKKQAFRLCHIVTLFFLKATFTQINPFTDFLSRRVYVTKVCQQELSGLFYSGGKRTCLISFMQWLITACRFAWVERESMCSAGKRRRRYIYVKVCICVGQISFDKQITAQNPLVHGQMSQRGWFFGGLFVFNQLIIIIIITQAGSNLSLLAALFSPFCDIQ